MTGHDRPGRELLAVATRDEWRRLRPEIEAMALRLWDQAELPLLETALRRDAGRLAGR